jgi:hypothetical protein
LVLTFDWRFKGFCDCDHDICAKHPKDVVDEETTEQDAASAHSVQLQELNPIDGKGQAKEIVRNPVLSIKNQIYCYYSKYTTQIVCFAPSHTDTTHRHHHKESGTQGHACQTHSS